MLATFVLVFVIFYIMGASMTLPGQTEATPIGLGSIGAVPVALLVWVLGLSLGSTTGYAINPARDIGPRLVLTLLPMKVNTDWSYAWVPGVAPMVGALLASGLYMMLQ